ncbi:MAG: 4Fe-4S binding protein [Bradymonadaceae bacterium]
MTLVLLSAASVAWATTNPPQTLDCEVLPCAEVLPGARRFEPSPEKAPYQLGYDEHDELVGWVVLSKDVVDIRAYSGKPMITLVGLAPDGSITGARLIHHTEPILLIGIPQSALTAFVDRYIGLQATTKVVVGSSRDPEAVAVDVVSGATVTALAQNQTILETARELGTAVGVIEMDTHSRGHFVEGEEPWTWRQMQDANVFGRITVTEEEMGMQGSTDIFMDLWFTLADAPHIGESILGPRTYARLMERRRPGEHLLVVLGQGSSSFKGSGFVRGGIFDRVRVEQGLRVLVFRDQDYVNVSGIQTPGAPEFKEGAVFITHPNRLDPGSPFDLVFIGSRYDGRGAYSRDFRAITSTHTLPRTVFQVDGSRRDQGFWRQAWYNQRLQAVVLTVYLLFIMGLFLARRFLTGKMARLGRLHLVAHIFSFVVLGLLLRAQPSVTQILTLVDGLLNEWRMGLFLAEPMLFISWIFIAITLLIWGRGVFCGWVCPYGAMSELLFKLGRLLRLPGLELPDRIHNKLRYLRYPILFGLIAIFLWEPILGEKMAEIEPFKSTFFVAPWTRPTLLLLWWLALVGLSLVWFRPFCRYLCPLGAALALPSSFRLSGPRRREFCSSCKICTRQCEPRAIRPDGTIDSRECLSCMECEANYRDETVCPPLVGLERLIAQAAKDGTAPNPQRLQKLNKQKERR